jgi:hypothetical protein
MDLSILREIASRRDSLIFVGSGVSAWSGMPTWWRMIQNLSAFLSQQNLSPELVDRELQNNDLLLAASYGFDKLSQHERCRFLQATLPVLTAKPSALHKSISKLGSRCFITTNYDDLLERTIREARPTEHFNPVTSLQQYELATIAAARSEGFIFKPHGDLGSCDSIILTREDYRTLHGPRRNVLEALRTLLVSRPCIFIGFGLRDPDFLLIHDLVATTFQVPPADHFALMPNVLDLRLTTGGETMASS